MNKRINVITESSKPIGVFDSGIGGLTVVKELNSILPSENIVYFGDTARVPYGNKSPDTVIKYSLEIAGFLVKKGVKIIVVACNTASSFSIEALRKKLNIPVIGVIEPGAKAASDLSESDNIGVIGTTGTVNSDAYSKALKKINPSVKVYQKACPLFVQLAEEGWTYNKIAYLTAQEYLTPLKTKNIDTLILGCTHYPLLKKVISEVMGKKVKLIDSGKETAREIKIILEKQNLINKKQRKSWLNFYVSDLPLKFHELSVRFLKQKIDKVHLIKTEEIINI